MDKDQYDVIVIGGGASGLFVSSLLGKQGKKTLLIEHNKEFGKKILISGGGRCNFTNANSTPEDFFGKNRHFHKSALSGYKPSDFIDLLKKYKIEWYEKKDGQLFCKESAAQVRDMLVRECETNNVKLLTSCHVKSIEHDHYYHLESTKGDFKSENVVIATGGLSIAPIGATDFGHRIASQFGHKLINPEPALVPFVLEPSFSELSGVSLPAKVTTGKNEITEDLLFTHKGMSGPAILKISLYWNIGDKIKIDFTLGRVREDFLKGVGAKTILNALALSAPKRFVEYILEELNVDKDKKVNETSKKDLNKIYDFLSNFSFTPARTEGFRKAEVTRGGVDVSKISSKTMESNLQKGLFFIGEVLDVTGQLGGFNFQWAWASAYACAQGLE